MDQNSGRFVNPSKEKTIDVDGKLLVVDDLEVDQTPPPLFSSSDSPAAPSSRRLPELGVGELTDLCVERVNGSMACSIVVEKIKANGKLFVNGLLGGSVEVGDVTQIKGVKFIVRRANSKGQIGLRMMTTVEIAEREARAETVARIEGAPEDAHLTQKRREIFDPTRVTVSEPTLDVYPVPEVFSDHKPSGTSAQLVRRSNQYRRLEELAIRRAKNRQESEQARESKGQRSEDLTGAVSDGVSGVPLDCSLTKAERRERGARLAAERLESKRLKPILRAQVEHAQEAFADELSRARQKKRLTSPAEAHAHMVRRALGNPVDGNPDFVGSKLYTEGPF